MQASNSYILFSVKRGFLKSCYLKSKDFRVINQ